ncbi:hypothetical protein KCU77_g20977, partial [Aureobasidium melanogenum]
MIEAAELQHLSSHDGDPRRDETNQEDYEHGAQTSRKSSTYGHSQLKTGHPVRSAIHKQLNGRLVLRWVTTWESLL